MINDDTGATMDEEENKVVENIDVVNVETNVNTGMRKATDTSILHHYFIS
jgi:hypothetical protein